MPALRATIALGVLLAAAGVVRGQPQPPEPATGPSSVIDEEARGVLLVNTDRETNEILKQAEAAIGHQDWEKAIELLHSLVVSDKRAFVRLVGERGRYASARQAAHRLLGAMSSEALGQYCRQYDGPAGKLFDEAQRIGDESLLRRVADEFFHTRYGEKALNLLGANAFDQGAYLAAGQLWERIAREHRSGKIDRPTLLAKAAVAYRLGGEQARSDRLVATLKNECPDAVTVVGGQRTPIATFIQKAMAAPIRASVRAPLAADWTSPAGNGSSTAAMSDLAARMFPLWTWPDELPARLGLARTITGLASLELTTVGLAVDGGRISATVQVPGMLKRTFALPCLVHPVVLKPGQAFPGGLIVARLDDAVVAWELTTGREIWRTVGLPMYRQVAARGQASNPFLMLAGDMGRYSVWAGEGKVFAVGRFQQINPATYRKYGLGNQVDSSSLAALSLADGRTLWEVGNGKGNTETLKAAKFLGAPAYDDGRLFVLAKYGNGYSVLCLDAQSGEQMWETAIGPIATAASETGSWQVAYTTELLTERASPIAVSNGRLYFTTNAGLVVCLSTATGQPQWAHQYDSAVSGSPLDEYARPVADRAYMLVSARRPLRPQNPLIVSAGRVLCLPADSESVLALSAQDGTLLWQKDRDGQENLTSLDDDRLLASGPDLVVLRNRDGELLKKADADVMGTPAASPGAVLASAQGKVLRLGLKDYELSEMAMPDDVLLGRLIAVDGKLISATAAGISAMFDFDSAWHSLAGAMDKARSPAQRVELRMNRGRFALLAGRVEDAATELRAVAEEARKLNGPALAAKVRRFLYQALLRQAELARSAQEAQAILGEAQKHASTPSDHAQLLLRTSRSCELAGRAADAVRDAQLLAEKYPDVLLESVNGDAAMTGYAAGQQQIGKLIAAHGRSVYAAIDQLAQKAVEAATSKADVEALLAAARQWPHASLADQALLSAAQTLYRRAVARSPADVALLGRASRVLGELLNYRQSPLATTARVAKALVDMRIDPWSAGLMLQPLAASASTRAKFADLDTTVGQAIELATKLRQSVPWPTAGRFAEISAPVRQAWTFGDARTQALRDSQGRPLVLGSRLMVLTSQGISCVDVAAADPESAICWSIALPERARLGQFSADRRLLGVVDRTTLLAISTADGRTVWRKPLTALGIGTLGAAMGEGDWLTFELGRGTLLCVDIARGEPAWKESFRGSPALIHGEMLQLIYRQDRYHTIVDLRNGRSIAPPSVRNHRDSLLTSDELLAMYTPDGLGILDPRRPKALAYTVRLVKEDPPPDPKSRRPPKDHPPFDLLDASRRYVAMRDVADQTIHVIDLEADGNHVVLGAPKLGDQNYELIQARLVDPVALAGQGATRPATMPASAPTAGAAARAYLLWGISASAQRGTGAPMWTSPLLAAHDPGDGRLLWTRSLAAQDAGPVSVWPTSFEGRTIGVLVKTPELRRAPDALFISAQTGQVVPWRPGDESSELPQRVRGDQGNPIVINGRAVVECESGLVILRGAL
jgi:outer membrane protein assembly factor BamB